jgi:predicted transcriptional regulator of viral defense system
MEAEGLVARIERGKYLLLGLSPERVLSNPLYIGTHLATPSYVSFWSALHYHGLTEQVPRTVFLATTRKKADIFYRGMTFKFITIQPQSFFGYQREIIADLPVVVADVAKAIIDCLSFPQYAGGFLEVVKSLRAAIEREEDPLRSDSLIEYVNRLGNRSLGSRLGYLLELFGQSTEGLIVSHGPLALDPQGPRQGDYNARWKVYINLSLQSLIYEGVA